MIHINAISKNTADDKIRQALRRFASEHPAPATVILISGWFFLVTYVAANTGLVCDGTTNCITNFWFTLYITTTYCLILFLNVVYYFFCRLFIVYMILALGMYLAEMACEGVSKKFFLLCITILWPHQPPRSWAFWQVQWVPTPATIKQALYEMLQPSVLQTQPQR